MILSQLILLHQAMNLLPQQPTLKINKQPKHLVNYQPIHLILPQVMHIIQLQLMDTVKPKPIHLIPQLLIHMAPGDPIHLDKLMLPVMHQLIHPIKELPIRLILSLEVINTVVSVTIAN